MYKFIIKSEIDFPSNVFSSQEKRGTYLLAESPSRDIDSILNNKELFESTLTDAIRQSDLLEVWKDKESIYSHITGDNSLQPEDKVCFSQEYYSFKSSIVSSLFSCIIITEDYDYFILRPEIKGTYEEFEKTGNLGLVYVAEYHGGILYSPYVSADFSSLEGYLSTRTDLML